MYSSGHHVGGGSITFGHHFTKRRKQRYKAVVRRTFPEPRFGTGIFASLCRELYWFRRQIQFSVCYSYTDPELDEFEEEFKPAPAVIIPPIEELCRSTGFTKEKIRYIYQEFKRVCPSGSLGPEDFCKVMKSMFPKSANNDYALRVYKALDRNERGTLRFEDLMETMVMLSQCSEKLRTEWIFNIIDSEQQTRVDFDQFFAYVHSVYSLLGASPAGISEPVHRDLVDYICDIGALSDNTELKVDWIKLECDIRNIFNDIDTDNDGWISSNDLEAFMHKTTDVMSAIESILHNVFPDTVHHYSNHLKAADNNHSFK
uniref:EF-hand domain-containing protein n=1 Tax=Plectus sambesii TaxID=2011161 RepID=A0A914WIY3_9BILA